MTTVITDALGYDSEYWYRRAVQRVYNEDLLYPLRDIILSSDWPEIDHFEWVATSCIKGIYDWASSVSEDAAYSIGEDEQG
jgi:hypothetical protein